MVPQIPSIGRAGEDDQTALMHWLAFRLCCERSGERSCEGAKWPPMLCIRTSETLCVDYQPRRAIQAVSRARCCAPMPLHPASVPYHSSCLISLVSISRLHISGCTGPSLQLQNVVYTTVGIHALSSLVPDLFESVQQSDISCFRSQEKIARSHTDLQSTLLHPHLGSQRYGNNSECSV